MARTIGSKNKPKTPFPVVDKKINDAYTKKEVDRLKNLVARQDDLIAQMLDELKGYPSFVIDLPLSCKLTINS